MPPIKSLVILTVVVLTSSLSGCKIQVREEPRTIPDLVHIATVRSAAEADRAYTGITVRVQSDLGFHFLGKITKHLVDAGQIVRAGQPLVRVDVTNYGHIITTQIENVEAARAKAVQAAADEARSRRLVSKGAASASSCDQVKVTADATKTQVAVVEAQAQVAREEDDYSLATTTTMLHAKSRCPGSVESLPYRRLSRSQIVVPVNINRSGPYNFLLDTGTQMTMIDPALAGELHLMASGEAVLRSGGVNATARMTQIDLVEAGSQHVAAMKVLVFDLALPEAVGHKLRGILGEDFLKQFDLLVDNAHGMVCLDDAGTMRAEMKGRRVELLAPAARGDELARPPVVVVKLSDGMRPVHLELDSGADVSMLYDAQAYMAFGTFKGVPLRGAGVSGTVRTFTALPPQTMEIGPAVIQRVPFITFMGGQKAVHSADFDGLLSIGLFKRVLIAHANHFAVLETWQ